MLNNKNIASLLKMANDLNKSLVTNMEILSNVIDEANRNAPEEQKAVIEKLKVNRDKILTLSKEGKHEEAINLINKLQDECKVQK